MLRGGRGTKHRCFVPLLRQKAKSPPGVLRFCAARAARAYWSVPVRVSVLVCASACPPLSV
eukprot:6488536-Prymnesium_polylepis.1